MAQADNSTAAVFGRLRKEPTIIYVWHNAFFIIVGFVNRSRKL
jgi:hypothetical protein